MTSLRPLRESDVEALSTWLPSVAAAARCERWCSAPALSAAVGTEGVLAAVEGADVEAFVWYETGSPLPDAVRVRFLAVEPAQRRLGIGGRAALALEKRVRRLVSRIYVAVPGELGLALYFWLRLGYRPLTQDALPARPEREPSVWMVREVGAQRR